MFRHCTTKILLQNVRWCIVGALRRRCFPAGETTGRATPAPWLSLWESWHGVAVTERVPCSNHGTFPKLATAYALSVSLRSPAPPEWEPRAAAPPGSHGLTLCGTKFTMQKFRCVGRATPAPWLSLWEGWHGAAVTERVPSGSQYARFLLNFRLPPAAEPGDPLRCGSTAWVTGSPLPAGATRPSQSRFARQLPHRGSQGRLRRRGFHHSPPNSCRLTLCAANVVFANIVSTYRKNHWIILEKSCASPLNMLFY